MNRNLIDNITAVILAGGKSEKLGMNKALLKIDDFTLIERAFEILNSIFDKIVISTNDPDEFSFIDTKKIHDIYPNLGPLSGIHSALNSSDSQRIFVLSCDMPFIIPSMIKHMLNIKSDEPIVLPKVEGKIEYLCGIYDKSILPILESVLSTITRALNNNEEVKNSAFSVWNFVERIGAELVDVEFERFYFNDLFFNINTMDDYEYVLEKL